MERSVLSNQGIALIQGPHNGALHWEGGIKVDSEFCTGNGFTGQVKYGMEVTDKHISKLQQWVTEGF